LQVNAPRLLRAYVEREKKLKALVDKWRARGNMPDIGSPTYEVAVGTMLNCADELLAVLEAPHEG
jgi:hypothetical protein